MDTIISGIQKIHNISNAAIEKLTKKLERIEMLKGDYLFSPNSKHHYINFLEKGIVRAYSYHQGKEVTFWFGLEGDVIFPYRTYLKDEISYETVEFMEDAIVYRIPQSFLKDLFSKDLEWANWGRNFAENQMVDLEERFIDYQFQRGAQRYDKLMKEQPGLINRVKLQYIASYLRMSQVSLSRIRSGLQ